MMRRKLLFGIVFMVPSAGVLGGVALGCIDLTPITLAPVVVDATGPEVSVVDGGAEADVDLRDPCALCLEGTGDAGVCKFEYDNCENDPICAQTLVCAIASGCLALATAQEVVGCGLPCAEDAGLKSQFDPPAQEVLGIVACGSRRCVGSCPWAGK
jgi:hypothetical protein